VVGKLHTSRVGLRWMRDHFHPGANVFHLAHIAAFVPSNVKISVFSIFFEAISRRGVLHKII